MSAQEGGHRQRSCEPQRKEHERNSEAERVHAKKHRALPGGRTGGRQREDGRKRRPDAGRPSDRERGPAEQRDTTPEAKAALAEHRQRQRHARVYEPGEHNEYTRDDLERTPVREQDVAEPCHAGPEDAIDIWMVTLPAPPR